MKSRIKQLSGLLLLAVLIIACQPKAGPAFELTGKLVGITDGKATLTDINDENQTADTILIRNGEFKYKRELPGPIQVYLKIEDKDYPAYFYAENVSMTITGHADSLFQATVTGGTINEDEKRFNKGTEEIYKKTKLDSLYRWVGASTSESTQKEIDAESAKYTAETDLYQLDFIKKYPASYYSAVLVSRMSFGMSAEEIEKNLAMLDPKLNEYPIVEEIRENVETLKNTDVKIEAFANNAPDMDFAPDKTYPGNEHMDMVYLASFPDDRLCALRKDGVVCLIGSDGKKISEFKTNLTARPTALAIDQKSGTLYVLGTIIKMKSTKFRGKEYQVEEKVGVECLVYDTKGTELKSLTLIGLKTASGAKVINGKLLVSDFSSRKVAIFNSETGAMESTISDLRACCGILDFGVNDKQEILVANLGAFRVQAFDYSGKIKYAFGRRGQGLNDFHGCCNPVNVAFLTNGAIITVEKDPTRIKVYSKSGAKKVEGIQELVKGCTYIPMTFDSKNNLYLASAKSGIIKCVPAPASK
jgi:hypothetical protein